MSGYSGVQLKTALPHSPQKLRVRGVPESVVGSLYDLRCGRPERIVKPSLGQMAAVKATLPVHFRHGMQWQKVS